MTYPAPMPAPADLHLTPPMHARRAPCARAQRRRFAQAAMMLALGLAGCSFTRTAPVKDVYLLEPAMPSPVARAQPVSVRMAAMNVAAPFRGRNFVYRTGALRYETDYYVEFLVAPAAMFTEQTGRALRAGKVFSRLVPPGSGATADFTLGGFVSAVYANVDGDGPATAELAITYFLTPEAGPNPVPVWSRTYREQVDVTPHTTAAYAAALNQAFSGVLAALVRDLAALDLAAPDLHEG